MSDRRNELDALDTVEMPVRWPDVERRRGERPPEPPLRHRLTAGLVAFAVFLGAAAVLWVAIRPDGRRSAADDEPSPTEEPSPSEVVVPAGEQVIVTIYAADMTDFDVYRMSPDGTELAPIIDDPAYRDSDAVLSPDGTRIAFVRSPTPVPGEPIYGGSDIYLMDLSTGDVRVLTHQPEGGATHDEPAWSPDGSRIAYRSNEAGPLDVWIMDADGSNQRRLTDGGNSNGEPVWSPDGTQIAFDSDRERQSAFGSNVWVMNADGSDPVRLTDTDAGDIVTSWSPDGSTIVFQRSVDESDYAWDVWAMNGDGSDQRQLTDWVGMDAGALWSPDGALLMFVSDRHLGEEQAEESSSPPLAVYVMKPDGTGVTQIVPPERGVVPRQWFAGA